MNQRLLATVSERMGHIPPPGCDSLYVDHPNPARRQREAIEIGFMMEHRFAFHYWLKSKQELMHNRRSASDEDFAAPDLVTWDWHNDCGADSDVIHSELAILNQNDHRETGFYCWAGLAQLNDGHILPAVWLNTIGNVYIIQKQHRDYERFNRNYTNRYGHQRQIRYFRSLIAFAEAFEQNYRGSGVIWDVDLDYFTRTRNIPDQRFNRPWRSEQIQTLLDPNAPWMLPLMRDLCGITIALEPRYTGGLALSLELYRAWETSLFSSPLHAPRPRWRS